MLVAGALSLLAELVTAAATASPEAAAAAHAAATPAALALLNSASALDSSVARACCDYVRALVLAGGPTLVASEGALEALSSPLLRLLAGGEGREGNRPEAASGAADDDDAAGRVAPALCALARRAPPGEQAAALTRASALAAARRLSLRAQGPTPMLAADCVSLVARAFAFGADSSGSASTAAAASETAAALAAVQVAAPPGSAAPSSNAPTELSPSSAALAAAPSGESQHLCSSPSPAPPLTLLHVALRFWACHQQDLLGASSINAAVAGLAALAALPSPSAVDAVLVRGARIEDGRERSCHQDEVEGEGRRREARAVGRGDCPRQGGAAACGRPGRGR